MSGAPPPSGPEGTAPSPSDPVALADGTVLEVRQLAAADGPELARAIGRLSEQSRYFRFFAPLPAVSELTLARLTDLDHRAREALIALDPATGELIAVSRFAEFGGDPTSAEVAITVADEWQGRGLGPAMLARILDCARATGHAGAHASVLAENGRALRMLERAGFRRTGRSGPVIELAMALGPAV